jgi:hypothetical protein
MAALNGRGVRFVVIGVSGANYYAAAGSPLFVTADRDLYLPPEAPNTLAAWAACESVGLELWSGREPLDKPRDLLLAEAVVGRRALVRASNARGLDIDLTLEMAGFEFETVWKERRLFRAEGVDIPVARLSHIVESKAAAGRPKDRLFLATHEEALREMLRRE